MSDKPLRVRFFNTAEQSGVKFAGSEDGSDRIMQGLATLYNFSTDLYFFTLSIDRQAFAESIGRADDIVALYNHDLNLLLGRYPTTLKLEWDRPDGLWTETKLPDHYIGRFVDEGLSRGDINQMSLAFDIREEEMIREDGKPTHYHVKKADLIDISAVTFAQIPETSVEVVSGEFKGTPEQKAKALHDALAERHVEQSAADQSWEESLEVYRLKQKHRDRF